VATCPILQTVQCQDQRRLKWARVMPEIDEHGIWKPHVFFRRVISLTLLGPDRRMSSYSSVD